MGSLESWAELGYLGKGWAGREGSREQVSGLELFVGNRKGEAKVTRLFPAPALQSPGEPQMF